MEDEARWHMNEQQLRAWANDTLRRLDTSKFRAGFTLSEKDRAYALGRGETTIREHARDLLRTRVGAAWPARDGKQTPFRGHPVFTAQHATATCCRGCIEKWHHIPKGRPLTDDELDDLTELVVRWIRRDIVRHGREVACAPASQTELDQHFLTAPDKIRALVDAAGIRPDDAVAELGAGIGSVAAQMPDCRSLTLVELDAALSARLRERFADKSEAHVVEGDAIGFLEGLAPHPTPQHARPSEQGRRHVDVIVSNLPYHLTPKVMNALARLDLRSAVVTVREGESLERWRGVFDMEEVERLAGTDFSPVQPFGSVVFAIRREEP